MTSATRIPAWTVGVLGLAVVAISSSAVLVAWADAPAVSLAFWRTAGGALILAPAVVKSSTKPDRRDFLAIVGAGSALAIHFATWLASLSMTSVAASVTLVSTAPIFVALISRLGPAGGGTNRIDVTTGLAIGAAVVGVAVITAGDAGLGSEGLSRRALAGDGLALVGAVAMAIYLMTGDRLRGHLGTAAYAGPTYAVAACGLLCYSIVSGIELTGYDRSTWLAIVGMVVGPQLAGHTLLNLLLRRLGSVTVSLALLAEVVGASILAWIFLAQAPPITAWIGAPIVLAAVGARLRQAGWAPRPAGRDT